jgi:actin-like ATPase involved in cell morphogenesis
MKSIDKAVEQSIKEIQEWLGYYPPERLKDIIKNAVEYGYQACTMDIDRRKKEEEEKEGEEK